VLRFGLPPFRVQPIRLQPLGRPEPVDVGASLADQPDSCAAAPASSLAIGLGANLGDPLATLVAVRPLLEQRLQGQRWFMGGSQRLRWSPLMRTQPVGGPPEQPPYLNAVLLVEGGAGPVDPADAEALLGQLQELEARFGRRRREHWGPRTLDLDLLWWGDLRLQMPHLVLPHPLLDQRSFVLAPLMALNPLMRVPEGLPSAGQTVQTALNALQPGLRERPPEVLDVSWLWSVDLA
jgi:2-amino-4-hydroxy-6-hydroxymethyldihydropteridine diphosphokinase